MRLHTHSGAARWHYPPPLNHIFPYQHCFVYVNHNENETTELHHFSHFCCNPSAKVGKLLLKLSRGCLDAHHPSVLGPSVPACCPRCEMLEGMPGTFMHAAAWDKRAAHYFWHQLDHVFLQLGYFPHLSPVLTASGFFVFCELIPIFV